MQWDLHIELRSRISMSKKAPIVLAVDTSDLETGIEWVKATENYLLKRENLVSLFVLLDVRHKPQRSDLEFMEFLSHDVRLNLLRSCPLLQSS